MLKEEAVASSSVIMQKHDYAIRKDACGTKVHSKQVWVTAIYQQHSSIWMNNKHITRHYQETSAANQLQENEMFLNLHL